MLNHQDLEDRKEKIFEYHQFTGGIHCKVTRIKDGTQRMILQKR
jgi:hypothetical protein